MERVDKTDKSFQFFFGARDVAPRQSSIALFTRYKLTRVRPGLKLTRVSFCRVNTANPGSTRASLSCKHH